MDFTVVGAERAEGIRESMSSAFEALLRDSGVSTEIFDENRLTEARSYWVKGLGHLTKKLPEFDMVIS